MRKNSNTVSPTINNTALYQVSILNDCNINAPTIIIANKKDWRNAIATCLKTKSFRNKIKRTTKPIKALVPTIAKNKLV